MVHRLIRTRPCTCWKSFSRVLKDEVYSLEVLKLGREKIICTYVDVVYNILTYEKMVNFLGIAYKKWTVGPHNVKYYRRKIYTTRRVVIWTINLNLHPSLSYQSNVENFRTTRWACIQRRVVFFSYSLSYRTLDTIVKYYARINGQTIGASGCSHRLGRSVDRWKLANFKYGRDYKVIL